MRILMLGWEYPPHISGGLGTACEGITHGLSHHGVEVVFVVPQLYGDEVAPHVALTDARGNIKENSRQVLAQKTRRLGARPRRVFRRGIESHLRPYLSNAQFQEENQAHFGSALSSLPAVDSVGPSGGRGGLYGGDIFGEVEHYAHSICRAFANEDFDIVHAHDWMTFPAGIALARLRSKPLVVHVHSMECDRSGSQGDGRIEEIERRGVHAAQQVVAVSYFTRNQLHKYYQLPLDKISVVHNGIYPERAIREYHRAKKWGGRLVLFLGRVTYQKGPEYFVETAAKVVQHVPDSMFVMAGSGDLLPRMVNRVQELGLERHFMFPGFLKGQEVEEMFSLADVYVMPSVSEPFGISALEAIKFETPVVLSRQSGVSEVVSHALKADFWDVDKMADLIINALLYPELREEMVAMAREEMERLHWHVSAQKLIEGYRGLI